MNDLKELQSQTQGVHILYVEDNEALRHNAAKLLKKFFHDVDVAADGEEGLKLFKAKHHHIVITDIKMPHMDGMTLSSHIHQIHPETKVIIMSAFDDKELLMRGIELGIFRFLKKPVNVSQLSKVLNAAIVQIKHEQHVKIFQTYLKNIFENQSSMVVLLHDSKIVLANDSFLNFFGFESFEECREHHLDITKYFLAQHGFLYSTNVDALEILKLNPQKLYNVKIADSENKVHHCIVKYQIVPQKEGYGILSFDDVTELNLLQFFAEENASEDDLDVDTETLLDFLDVIARNEAKIELHNYYKGLSITHEGVIEKVSQEALVVKTSFMQQKAIQIEKRTLIVSPALPHALEATSVQKINFEQQRVVLSGLRFVKSSPITRKTIRVVPGEKQTISLFLHEGKYRGDISIEDISLDAVKLKLSSLPAGMEKGTQVTIDIVLELDKKPLIINAQAKFYRKQESKRSFSLVFLFTDIKKSGLIKYITKRQMELIREIKGMQNG